jgi:hypothetical protein
MTGTVTVSLMSTMTASGGVLFAIHRYNARSASSSSNVEPSRNACAKYTADNGTTADTTKTMAAPRPRLDSHRRSKPPAARAASGTSSKNANLVSLLVTRSTVSATAVTVAVHANTMPVALKFISANGREPHVAPSRVAARTNTTVSTSTGSTSNKRPSACVPRSANPTDDASPPRAMMEYRYGAVAADAAAVHPRSRPYDGPRGDG